MVISCTYVFFGCYLPILCYQVHRVLDRFYHVHTDSSHELLELQLFMFEQIDLHIFKPSAHCMRLVS